MCGQVLVNMVRICACFEMQELLQTVLKALERFLMQLCFTINQASNRKMRQGLVNPLNQAATAPAIEDTVCQNLESRFRWQAIFDLMFLYKLVCNFFSEFLAIDGSLRDELVLLKEVLEDQDHPTTRTVMFLVNTGQRSREWSDQLYTVWLG